MLSQYGWPAHLDLGVAVSYGWLHRRVKPLRAKVDAADDREHTG